MAVWLIITVIVASLIASLMLATLTYALRDYSRARLEVALERRNRLHLIEPLVDHCGELAFLTALFRLVMNLIVLLSVLHLTTLFVSGVWNQYLVALGTTAVISTLFGVTIPHALALHAGEGIIASCAGLMVATRRPLRPFVKLLHAADSLVRRATQPQDTATSAE
ncbi:MAG TPA: CNNM domain-containing protein, partial [Tepidisphaeraceae bacterium]|nr:CNNM domain-containing protein [Tepidisphaeraceae bacterium]